ncbi:MerR family transcriptional regulator [Bacillus sp. V3B]|uniref:MerR family transcriptional regulator n=1 Tax=Bacillus sp. V3B TaxID=2804915 RepID=UPI00210D8D1B|nr:MerR family transcriptional regulator [Bacillus sp. V3B]MCQ6277359.1 MerR family transcriptional regulator [Bacillus sp. V3B]
MMNNRQILRAYSIKEVSQIINIPTGTIRQWEKDLNGLLVIPRTQQGARYYTDNEIKILKKIKEMREQHVSKGMIRTLLEKHLNEGSESPSEPFEMAVQPVQDKPTQASTDIQTNNTESMEAFYTAMETFKQDLLNEIKNEIATNKNDLIDEMKNELSNSSLVTVKEVSKSIQRSNDKRKVEMHEITNTIMKASELTSETFATLSNDILNDSEATYEKLSKRINQSSKLTERDNKAALEKVSQTVTEAKDEIRSVSEAFDAQQDFLIESLNELKQSQEEIKKREEVFQSMISSYREVATAKTSKKKWWQGWFH